MNKRDENALILPKSGKEATCGKLKRQIKLCVTEDITGEGKWKQPLCAWFYGMFCVVGAE